MSPDATSRFAGARRGDRAELIVTSMVPRVRWLLSALLWVAAMLAPTACVTPPRIPAAAESISALAGEPRIVAVHYHDLGTRGPLRDDAGIVRVRSVQMAAPTGLIQDRFVQSIRSRLGLPQIRSVPEPRFAYSPRGLVPDASHLKRTFGRGLAFDFYSPWRYLSTGGGSLGGPLTVQARLVRLDDLSVLWADSCSFDAGSFPNPLLFTRIANVEQLYTPTALARAAGCADTLVARLLGTDR